MGEPGKRDVSRTHSLFVDDLKVYQESHNLLKEVNEVIAQTSLDMGACYGVSECAEIMFEHGKMVKGEGFQVLQEKMKTLDPDQEEMYKFFRVERADGIKTKQVYERVTEEMTKRLNLLMKSELP